MLLSRHQNIGQNRDIKIAKKSFENLSQFNYLGTPVTNQNLLSSRLLSKNLETGIYKTIILLVVLYGCETWSLIKGGT
jgi:hypothetical protein